MGPLIAQPYVFFLFLCTFTIITECLLQDLQHSLSVSDDEIEEAAVDEGAPLASLDWSTRNALFF